jgi:hypothetical protein
MGMDSPSFGRLAVVAGITLAVAGAGGGTAYALSHRSHDGPTVHYSSAAQMAKQAGCAQTFHARPAPAGVRSAGRCIVEGHEVSFRVQRVIDPADAWPGRHGPVLVGSGWMVNTQSFPALAVVSRRLG